ncbi:MAG: cell envelope protein SmpA [Maricaulis sp.]|jgi:outer membrane protein assembly factor BamE (lipoprotein component of BamABCDE complex)|nr:cell envelope protein SmpA [Maricaulis sp.]HAQ34626.1 outer membrane protein assembly factor BamE [Alphaproteobacteria bacterium]
MTKTRFAAVIALCAIGITACTPTLRNHGYAYVNGETPVITPGEDNQTTLVNRLGNPSTRGVFETDTWYYISATRETLAYQLPQTRERRIMAVEFDETGTVVAVEEYGLEDGRRVNLVRRETPTRGRELTFLEQVLGNIGRLPAGSFTGEENLPGGAGGPRRDQ